MNILKREQLCPINKKFTFKDWNQIIDIYYTEKIVWNNDNGLDLILFLTRTIFIYDYNYRNDQRNYSILSEIVRSVDNLNGTNHFITWKYQVSNHVKSRIIRK